MPAAAASPASRREHVSAAATAACISVEKIKDQIVCKFSFFLR